MIGSSEVGVAVGAGGAGPAPRAAHRPRAGDLRRPLLRGPGAAAARRAWAASSATRTAALYAFPTAGERVSYVATSAIDAPVERALAADRAERPRDRGERFLQLPPLSPEVAELAREVTAGLATDAERVARDRAPPPHARALHRLAAGARIGDGARPIESFLLDAHRGPLRVLRVRDGGAAPRRSGSRRGS